MSFHHFFHSFFALTVLGLSALSVKKQKLGRLWHGLCKNPRLVDKGHGRQAAEALHQIGLAHKSVGRPAQNGKEPPEHDALRCHNDSVR
jgi:hypothetical protein